MRTSAHVVGSLPPFFVWIMQKVRYTIDELRGNIKLLLLVSFITTITIVVCQFLLINLEKKSYQTQVVWTENAKFISDFKSAFYRIHDENFSMTKEYAILISHSIQQFDNENIVSGPYKDFLTPWQNALENLLDTYTPVNGFEHEHQNCVALSTKIDALINKTTIEHLKNIEQQQERIDMLNLIIFLLPIFLLALLTYAAFFSHYGQE